MPDVVHVVEIEENTPGVEFPRGGGSSLPAVGVLHEEEDGKGPSDAGHQDVEERHQFKPFLAAELLGENGGFRKVSFWQRAACNNIS